MPPSVNTCVSAGIVFCGELADTFGVDTLITDDVEKAAEIIRGGGIAAFPTETVYGLGANAFDGKAIRNIFVAKKRPADNPLIVHINNVRQIAEIATDLNESAERFIECFFPGPLTIVAKSTGRVSELATCGMTTVAFRMPVNDLAKRLITACGFPLVAPSANISGRPSPTTWFSVAEDMSGEIDCILKGEPTQIGLESTVVDCTNNIPILLRAGAISIEQLRTVVSKTEVLNIDDNLALRSPGLRHRHYSPKAKIVIIENAAVEPEFFDAAYIGLEPPASRFSKVKICSSVEEYARAMFEFFRECDRAEITSIYCQSVAESGIGTAIMDRLRRAAVRD